MDSKNIYHNRGDSFSYKDTCSRQNDTYMPHFHLYPSHPQILHSLVVELFVRVQACTVDHCSVLYTPACSSHTYTLWTVPHGPIYRYGGRLAGMWKSIV